LLKFLDTINLGFALKDRSLYPANLLVSVSFRAFPLRNQRRKGKRNNLEKAFQYKTTCISFKTTMTTLFWQKRESFFENNCLWLPGFLIFEAEWKCHLKEGPSNVKISFLSIRKNERSADWKENSGLISSNLAKNIKIVCLCLFFSHST